MLDWSQLRSLTGAGLRPWARFHPFHHHRASSSVAGFIAPAAFPGPHRGLFLSPTLCICSYLRLPETPSVYRCTRFEVFSSIALQSKDKHRGSFVNFFCLS